jgi:hypothetical protein
MQYFINNELISFETIQRIIQSSAGKYCLILDSIAKDAMFFRIAPIYS